MVKKITISKLFLYRYRFIIGYIVLGIAFFALLITMPIFAQSGLSEAEITSATSSYYLGKNGILSGDLVDLPYRLLQKASIVFFGLSAYSIKLPSIIIGLLLGFLLILLLNRWFKNNVSLLVSCLIILSTPFLFLAGSGTPLIMLVFWPTLLFCFYHCYAPRYFYTLHDLFRAFLCLFRLDSATSTFRRQKFTEISSHFMLPDCSCRLRRFGDQYLSSPQYPERTIL